ncbi:WD40 repeat domain-containing protein [Aspergillus saccharolyticus JOP 1030-1]|uniref:YVTN repeat-like/Quino protein amine dehydrogenase n=1 Tax=Aspergillus saccharolyticus JOP 1030-1 TaxID=1450539 RepID=A0A318Z2F4_9EURO|nr:YVTN repeat-like/Quino protein amine dehydrogenase [Aspergillus saccharolyticus JOP 1030-1]PYH41236.1 YVTN repeat-like/Quino protein amine dehydrogenase [Aspergillus saccharolyticus JOP 1030-1]
MPAQLSPDSASSALSSSPVRAAGSFANTPFSNVSRPSSQPPNWSPSATRQDMTPPEGDGPPPGASASFVADPRTGLDMTLMAVPQFPNAPRDAAPVAVTAIVNAVMEPEGFARYSHAADPSTPRLTSSSPSREWYDTDSELTDSEMTDVLSDVGGVPLGPYLSAYNEEVPGPVYAHGISSSISEMTDDDEDEDEAADLIIDYDSSVVETRPTTLSELDHDPDDTYKFYMDDGGEESDYEDPEARARRSTAALSEVDFDEFYQGLDSGYVPQSSEMVPGAAAAAAAHDDHSASVSEGDEASGVDAPNEQHVTDPAGGTVKERNLTIDQFLGQWCRHSYAPSMPYPSRGLTPISRVALDSLLVWTPPAKIVRPAGYRWDFFDIQQIPWKEVLQVKRSYARELRDHSYTSYHNLEYSRQRPGARLPQDETFFREKAMYTGHKASIEHFQLRNLMSAAAYHTVHFAHESKIYSWVPVYDELRCLIDLSKPTVESGLQAPVKISTMKSAHDITIAGGFAGEYALRALGTAGSGIAGYVTQDPNGITNHIDVVPSRSSRSPLGIFASNDRHLRVLDCETNTFLADYELSRAVNCTATAPDGRLRVVIGDSPDAWVVEADSGRPVHPLRGHRDFGFACAWSPDMRHIATSNQDKTAIIWDVRMWRMLQKIESDVAGYRSVRFSPVGGGSRTLLLCEPADRVTIVNAQTYQGRQVHDFFGEIGGADYSPDGSTIWVANTDEHFGGFMEYERRQWGQRYGPQGLPNEWTREAELDEDERCLLRERERQQRVLWNLGDEEHEALIL